MGSKGRIMRVFPGGNTSRGYYSFFDSIIREDARHVYIIKGGPGTGKSTFMKSIGDQIIQLGYDLEYHHCSSAPDSLDALVIPDLRVAMLDGTAPHIMDPVIPGAVDKIINLGDYWDEKRITGHRAEIVDTNKETNRFFKTAYSLLKESKVAYDDLSCYIWDSIDKIRYNKITRILIDSVFADKAEETTYNPKTRHLFASAISPVGIVDYVETLLDEDMRVYSIKGSAGSGVKELIGRLANDAGERGFYTLRLHCPYEPEKLDMLLIPSIGTAVLNSSQPHHLDIKKLNRVNIIEDIDLNTCIQKAELEPYGEEMQDARARYRSLIDKAVHALSKAMEIHDRIEGYYIDAMDFERVNQKKDELLEKILDLVNK
ncbi:MAG TPA: PRK06851 family protein [Bacillota bacterium]|nr:PRK06851 family protein [Bacillota bacterium]